MAQALLREAPAFSSASTIRRHHRPLVLPGKGIKESIKFGVSSGCNSILAEGVEK